MDEIKPLSVDAACQELRLWMSALRVEGDGTLDGQPEVLYHYTSLDSARKLLETRKLWASRVYFLNDASEVEYGAGVVSEYVESYPGTPEAFRELFRRGPRGEESDFIRTTKKSQVHVFCLSSQEDSLSQWRAYGRSGGGVAIGFKKDRLLGIKARGQRNFAFQVIYERESQLATMREPMRAVEDVSSRISDETQGQLDFWIEVFVQLGLFAFRFKNPAFREEEEWRLFWLELPDVQFRLASDSQTLVPYIEAEFSPDAVCRIVQGPLTRPEVGESSLKEFLTARSYGHVEVTASGIPLRAL
jgi:hypothetical protein